MSGDDFERACREIARIDRAAERARFAEDLRRGLRTIKAAQRAGVRIRSATIEGVVLDLGDPEPAKAPAENSQEPPALFHTRKNPKVKVVL
jgi:hypothetical protein